MENPHEVLHFLSKQGLAPDRAREGRVQELCAVLRDFLLVRFQNILRRHASRPLFYIIPIRLHPKYNARGARLVCGRRGSGKLRAVTEFVVHRLFGRIACGHQSVVFGPPTLLGEKTVSAHVKADKPYMMFPLYGWMPRHRNHPLPFRWGIVRVIDVGLLQRPRLGSSTRIRTGGCICQLAEFDIAVRARPPLLAFSAQLALVGSGRLGEPQTSHGGCIGRRDEYRGQLRELGTGHSRLGVVSDRLQRSRRRSPAPPGVVLGRV